MTVIPPPDPGNDLGDLYGVQLAKPYITPDELPLIQELLGRPSKARAAVAVRCANGIPAVLRCDPYDVEGNPFPTMFWLCAPLAASKIGGLESTGVMSDLTEQVRADTEIARRYREAKDRFLALRDQLPGGPIPGDPTQGGMAHRVKCLHSLYAHWLATGDNPIGEWVQEQLAPMPCHAQCQPATRREPETGR